MKYIDPSKITEEEKKKQIEDMWDNHENNYENYNDDYLYILDEDDEFYD